MFSKYCAVYLPYDSFDAMLWLWNECYDEHDVMSMNMLNMVMWFTCWMWYHCNYLDMNAKSFTHSLCRSIFIIFICTILVASNKNRVFLPMCVFETKSIWNMKMKFLSNVFKRFFKICVIPIPPLFFEDLYSLTLTTFQNKLRPHFTSRSRENVQAGDLSRDWSSRASFWVARAVWTPWGPKMYLNEFKGI